MNKLVDGKMIAELLGDLNYFTIMAWAEQGRIPSIKVGRLRKFDPDQVLEWIRSGKMKDRIEKLTAGRANKDH